MVWICLVALAISLAFSFPIAMCLGVAALAGILYASTDLLVILPQRCLASIDSFPLLAIPLFILAGQIMGSGGIARRIVNLAMLFVGRIRGGLGMVSILATMLFSGISGSSSADTAAIGSITLPAMKKRGYPKKFATSLVAAAGGTASLVPPSIDFIVIGVVANISIGGLFAAGFLPGAVNGAAIMALVYYYGWKLDLPLEPKIPFKEQLKIVLDGVLSLFMAVIILGGILGGIFTPTEASAVAVVYGLIISLVVYREIKLSDIPKILIRASEITGVVMLVLGMASIFSFVLTFERIPHLIGEFIVNYAGNWIVFVIFVNILFLFLGMIMDGLAALIVLMPIIVPAAVKLGMEPIHIGILCANNIGISMISPPVGVCLYVACGLSDLPLEDIIKPMLPFLLVLLGTLVIISYVPAITLFVPRMLGYVGG
ncbi:MAG TPA: TRAP transporter large permease [Desulfatiglandales bacterium]|nr:TRAP transporter large permease [Desulfatiglandales bacterium]